MLPILVCRVAWMPDYVSEHEPTFADHGWVRDGNEPFETRNFLEVQKRYYGYVQLRGDAQRKPGRINIDRIGATPSDEYVSKVYVVFCARHPQFNNLLVVGWYEKARVYRTPISAPNAGKGAGTIVRMTTETAISIAENERDFVLPTGKGGVGQSDLWYGLQESKDHEPLKENLLSYMAENRPLELLSAVSLDRRSRVLAARIERHSCARKFLYLRYPNGAFRCDACDFCIQPNLDSAWRASFEIHHLKPLSELTEGDELQTTEEDIAVLCANCHRAIHRTAFVSDIAGFRKAWKLKR